MLHALLDRPELAGMCTYERTHGQTDGHEGEEILVARRGWPADRRLTTTAVSSKLDSMWSGRQRILDSNNTIITKRVIVFYILRLVQSVVVIYLVHESSIVCSINK